MILSRALITYHVTQLRQSPATGVFLTCGWVAGVLLTFISGQLFATNRAELTALFTYLPWIMAVLIPTLTMPVASEDARGVSERLLTLPFTPAQRFFSRFAVYWALLGGWILGFWPLVATLYYLGSPDFGPIFTGFLGTWLLAAPMLAACLAICLHARSAVGGLLGSLVISFIFLLIGTDTVTSWFASFPGLSWLPSVASITLLGAYLPFTVGLLNLSAMLLLAGLFLLVAGLALTYRVNHRNGLPAFVSGGILTLLAILPGFYWMQLDLTSEGLHTPSQATLTALRSLPEPVTFTLHFSQNNPDVPPAVHKSVQSLTSLLLHLRASASGKVNVKTSNSDSSAAAAISALQAGATEQSLPTGTTYFAALTAAISDTTQVMPVIDPARQPVQEYDIMTLVSKLTRSTAPTIAVLSGSTEAPQWQQSLATNFTINPITVGATEIPSDTSVLLLPNDPALPTATIQAIRNYLAQGGNVVLMADSFTRTSQPASAQPNEQHLSEILPEFGLTFVSQTVVADPSQATLANQSGAGAMPYPYWLQLNAKNLDATLPFTAGISKLFLPESGELLTESAASTTLTVSPILTTSAAARSVPLATFRTTPAELANTNLPAETGTHILAAMSSGAFTEAATRTGNLVVFADNDWLANTSIQQAPDNLTLLTNLMHYLSGQSTLTQLRAKGATPRTLTRVEDMANRLAQQTARTEAKIATRLYEVTNPSNPDEAEAQANAEEEAFTLRQQLRDIRQQTRHHLQTLENALLILNLVLMPTVIGVLFLLQRRRQRLKATSTL